mmetsp:Transcript_30622/g.73443  ORF Transcript_30622/g.73443 Transcript_30622/m.73443 type:complete len:210 (-) Transcript_30622:327-956(-)|eukprot:CAMPEP_0113655432 /NCGR_PEP_ID=MMETSP0017_2-20120614/29710_1 /TAXON_ID=2856 /ORGANISM="Cylindrotheca closterium" /LENGTH=209 /DNA_ID=CAMNT_0000568693 /DNA_START=201 /DNA_END=830 /DNA_ORIENTATION=+ /assembly_acc=CAM_ASM_000147
MSLHLSILRRSDLERPKGIHKRARTSSTELLDEDDEQHDLIVLQLQGPPINWRELILNQNTSSDPKIVDMEKLRSASFSSAESTTLSEDEMSSLHSLIEQTETFESGFDTFDDFLNYSNSNLDQEEETLVGDKVKTKKSKSKLKRKLKKLKTKLKTSFHVKKQIKSIYKNSRPILRAISNATALVFRGVLFLTVNVLIVLTVILSLALV